MGDAWGKERGIVNADDALRLAAKLAIDEGDFDRAAEILTIAKRVAPKPASVTPLAAVRRGREEG